MTPQEQQIINEWFRRNQHRITLAVLTGMSETDVVAGMLVDPTVTTAERWHQFFEGLDTAGHAVLAEHIADAFRRVFAHESAGIQGALVSQSESIVRENIDEYIAILMALAASARSQGDA